MDHPTQHMLNFLCDRAGKSPDLKTSIPWPDVIEAAAPTHGHEVWREVVIAGIVQLRELGYIKTTPPNFKGVAIYEPTGALTYSVTARGLKAYTGDQPEPEFKTWREKTPEERARS